MQINRLRLINFRQHEDTELVLGSGLTGIVGPNGSGKSTLLEALAWAIYGMPAARGSRDSIRRRRAPARSSVRVELDFCLGSHQYRVLRTLNNAELYQDAESAPIATSLGTVTEKLTRVLGMTREEFFNTYFTGQKELAVMAAMTAPERAQFLSRVLGYEKLRVAQDRLKEKRGLLKARLHALESNLLDTAELEADETMVRDRIARAQSSEGSAVAQLARAVEVEESLKPRLEAMQRLKQLVAELNGELKLADHKVSEAKDRHEQLDRQLIEALAARDKVRPLLVQLEPLASLKSEAETLDAQERTVLARQGFEAQLADLRSRQAAVKERLALIPTAAAVEEAAELLDEARTRRAASHAAVDEWYTAWVRDLQDAKTKRQTLLDQYQDIKEQRERLVKLGPDGACPTCTRPLGTEFANVVGVLDRQLEAVLNNGTFYKQRIDQLAQPPAELVQVERARDQADQEIHGMTERLVQLRALTQEEPALREEERSLLGRVATLERSLAASAVPYDRPRHDEVRKLLAGLEEAALQVARLKVLADRAEDLVKEAELAERSLSEREGHAREIRERMETLGYREWDHTALRAEVETANQARREADLSVIRVRAELVAAEEALKQVARRKEERERREWEAREVSVELALNGEVDRAFTDLRSELNANLRPDLSDNASGFLRDMTGGRYSELELDEDFIASIVDDGETKPVISGGEEDLVNLALRLAISQMIAERSGQPLSLLVLDEIFGSLDEDRRNAVLELLRGLADRFPQVILITHIESVREGFDRVIRVNLDVERGAAVVQEEAGGTDGLAA
jgi:exonuclease SbcC